MSSIRFTPLWQRIFIVLLIIALAMLFVIPMYWNVIWGSWHTNEIFSYPPKVLPGPFLLDNLSRLQHRLGISRALINSIVATAISVVGALFFCTLAGFSFAKYKFKFKNLLFYLLLATMAVPGQITSIPLFIQMSKIKWVDTLPGLVVPGLVPAFGVFLMRMSIEGSLPNEILESARMDGANELRIFFQIVLPNILPQMGALSIFMFTGSWGSLFWPLIILRSTENFTLPLALSSIIGAYERPYDLLMVGSLISIIPPVLLFLIMQKNFVKSIVASAFR